MKKIVFGKVKRKIGRGLVQLDVFDCIMPEIININESDYTKSRKKDVTVCLEYIYENNEYRYSKIIGILHDCYYNELAKYEITKALNVGVFKGRIKCIRERAFYLKDMILLNIGDVDNDAMIDNLKYILTLKEEMEVHNGDILSGNYSIIKLETLMGVKYILLSEKCRKLKNKK